MAKISKTELKKFIAVSTSDSMLMTTLLEHLDKNCSDAEKLKNIRNFAEVRKVYADRDASSFKNYYTFHYNSVV